ncbi:MAG: M23 family metallopeptidase [Sphingobacteriales bacterium]|nr:MAG: M23 family metallopeptidase [Sphingobacteriales bacterium]
MDNLQLLSLFVTALVWFVIGLFSSWLIYRAITVFILKRPRVSWRQVERHRYIKCLKIATAAAFAILLLTLPFHLWIGASYRRLMPWYVMPILLSVLMVWTALELYLSFSMSARLQRSTFKKVMLTITVALLVPASSYYLVTLPQIFTYPAGQECMMLDLPVKGEWSAGHAGGSKKVNYHCALRAQKYAMDITKVNVEGAFYKGEGGKVEDFYTTNQPIYAPASGTVVRVTDSFENSTVMSEEKVKTNPAGNHVVIEIAKDRYVFLAHLNRGSIVVKEGDHIKSGDLVGKAGNSGNTSWPHLHMHIQDIPVIDNRNAIAYPYRFATIERKRWFGWAKVVGGFLLRNDVFRAIGK